MTIDGGPKLSYQGHDMRKTSFSIILAVFAFTFIGASSTASRAADFYKGKTTFHRRVCPRRRLRYLYSRYCAPYRQVPPGNPTSIVENMEGAGSLLAANYMFNKADPDGLTVGNFNSGMVTQEALGSRGGSASTRASSVGSAHRSRVCRHA